MEFSKTLNKNRATISFSSFTPGHISENNKQQKTQKNHINLKRYTDPMFISALFTIAEIWKQPIVHQVLNE